MVKEKSTRLTGFISFVIRPLMSPRQIRKIREVLKLTQQEMADSIGATQVSVARWETGVNAPRGANLKALKELAQKAAKKR